MSIYDQRLKRPRTQRSWLLKHPVKSMVVAAVTLALLGIILIFTVAGAIIGIPLLAAALVLGIIAKMKMRHISHHHHHSHTSST